MDAVAVVVNALGIELVRSYSDYAEEIAELSEGTVYLTFLVDRGATNEDSDLFQLDI